MKTPEKIARELCVSNLSVCTRASEVDIEDAIAAAIRAERDKLDAAHKALALVRAECRAWRYLAGYQVAGTSMWTCGRMGVEIGEAVATDAANALNVPEVPKP